MVIPTLASSLENRGLGLLHAAQSPLCYRKVGCVSIHERDGICLEEVAQQGRSQAPWGDLPGEEHISTALLDELWFHRCVLVGVGWGRGQISALRG